MSDLRKAAEMALEALERYSGIDQRACDAEEALRQALAQEEQEPVAWGFRRKDGAILDIKNADEHEGYEKIYTVPLYTAPPKQEWVGLTDEERFKIARDTRPYVADTMRAHEEELKRRNT